MIFFFSLFFFSFPLGDNVHCIAKGELKMERHKGSLFFQRRTEGLRAGIRQGQEKNGTARVGGGGGGADENGSGGSGPCQPR